MRERPTASTKTYGSCSAGSSRNREKEVGRDRTGHTWQTLQYGEWEEGVRDGYRVPLGGMAKLKRGQRQGLG